MKRDYFKILKKYGYLFMVLVFFLVMGIGGFVKNVMAGQCNIAYFKEHLLEPFWEGMFQTETPVVSAKDNATSGEERETQAEKAGTASEKEMQIEKAGAASEQKVKAEKAGVSTEKASETKRGEMKRGEGTNRKTGITKFKTYTPRKIKSPYYTDL